MKAESTLLLVSLWVQGRSLLANAAFQPLLHWWKSRLLLEDRRSLGHRANKFNHTVQGQVKTSWRTGLTNLWERMPSLISRISDSVDGGGYERFRGRNIASWTARTAKRKCKYSLVCISILCVRALPLPLSFKYWPAQYVRCCLVETSVHHNI